MNLTYRSLAALIIIAVSVNAINTPSWWKGAANDRFSNANAWSPIGVPGATNDVIFDGDSSNFFDTVVASISVNSVTVKPNYTGKLIINSGQGITVGDSISIQNTITNAVAGNAITLTNPNAIFRLASTGTLAGNAVVLTFNGANSSFITAATPRYQRVALGANASVNLSGAGGLQVQYISAGGNYFTLGNGARLTNTMTGGIVVALDANGNLFSLGTNDTITGTGSWTIYTGSTATKTLTIPNFIYTGSGTWLHSAYTASPGKMFINGKTNIGSGALWINNATASAVIIDTVADAGSFSCAGFRWGSSNASAAVKFYLGPSVDTVSSWDGSMYNSSAIDSVFHGSSRVCISGNYIEGSNHKINYGTGTLSFIGTGTSSITSKARKINRILVSGNTNSKSLSLADSLAVASLIDSVGKITQNKKVIRADTLQVSDTGTIFDTTISVIHLAILNRKSIWNTDAIIERLSFGVDVKLVIGAGKTIDVTLYTENDWGNDSIVSGTPGSKAYVDIPASVAPTGIYAKDIGARSNILDLSDGGINGGNDSNIIFSDSIGNQYNTPTAISIANVSPGIRDRRSNDTALISGSGFWYPLAITVGKHRVSYTAIDSKTVKITSWPDAHSAKISITNVDSKSAIIDSSFKYTWDGSEDNSWSAANNWTPAGPPSFYDTAIFDGTGSTDCVLDVSYNIAARIMRSAYSGVFDDAGKACTTGIYDSIAVDSLISNGILTYWDSTCYLYFGAENTDFDSLRVVFKNECSFKTKNSAVINTLELPANKNANFVSGTLILKSPTTPLLHNHTDLTSGGTLISVLTESDTFTNTNYLDTIKGLGMLAFKTGKTGITGYVPSFCASPCNVSFQPYGDVGGTIRTVGKLKIIGGDLNVNTAVKTAKFTVYFDSSIIMSDTFYTPDGTHQIGASCPKCSLEVHYGNAEHYFAFFKQDWCVEGSCEYDSGWQRFYLENSTFNINGDWVWGANENTVVIPGNSKFKILGKTKSYALFPTNIATRGKAFGEVIDSMPENVFLNIFDSLHCASFDRKDGHVRFYGALNSDGNISFSGADSLVSDTSCTFSLDGLNFSCVDGLNNQSTDWSCGGDLFVDDSVSCRIDTAGSLAFNKITPTINIKNTASFRNIILSENARATFNGTGAATFSGMSGGGDLVFNQTGSTAFCAAIKADSLDVLAGAVALAGGDSIDFINVGWAGALNCTGDTVVVENRVITDSTSTLTFDAATLWTFTASCPENEKNGKTWPAELYLNPCPQSSQNNKRFWSNCAKWGFGF